MTAFSRPTRPADDFQIRRAQALCAESPELQASLDEFLGTAPSYGQMDGYLKQLKTRIAADLAAALAGGLRIPRG